MNAFSIGTAGLAAASQRFDQAAQRTVSGDENLVDGVVEQTEAATDYAASLAVIRTANDMSKRLLDILV